MKKILLSLFTLMVGLSAFAQTEYSFDNATVWGYDNPAQGEFTQVPTGGVVQNGNLKITVTFPEGKNGLRFFSHSTTGTINLRGYVDSEVTIATVDGSAMTAVEFAGTNLGASYVKGEGYENGTWKGNANSFTLNIIKSTIQINTIKVYSGGAAPTDISNTPETAYTTTQALALIEKGEGLSTKVYVKGTITTATVALDYGNADYTITDGTSSLLIYRGYGLKGNKFTSADDIQDGDEVIVYGQLVDYNGTKEMTSGSQIYSLNGKTDVDTPETPDTPEDPYTLVGAGTFENPYTTADIIKGIYKDGEVKEGVWVKGTILGCFGSEKEPISSKDAVASNIALGNADGTSVIPVQLVYVKDGDNRVREAINVMDNPSNIGKEVYVFGNVEKYFSVAGLKSTSNYSWDGKTSSIKSIATSASSTIYNLNGQKLAAPQKGINIVNGVKVLVK